MCITYYSVYFVFPLAILLRFASEFDLHRHDVRTTSLLQHLPVVHSLPARPTDSASYDNTVCRMGRSVRDNINFVVLFCIPIFCRNSFARYRPQRHHCQFCNNNIVTEVVYEAGNMTFLAAGGIIEIVFTLISAFRSYLPRLRVAWVLSDSLCSR